MDERERLERAIQGVIFGREASPAGWSASELVKAIADAVTKTREEPTPRPVWPGLEGKSVERVREVWSGAYNAASVAGASHDEAYCAAESAVTAHLFRALVAGLPSVTGLAGDAVCVGRRTVSRAALAALADPYDGGGK